MTQMAERAVTDRAPAAMIAGAIPLIDVAGHLGGDAGSSREAAAQLRWAFENVGFYYLSGHGVPQSLIDRTYDAAARFHAQPMAAKLALEGQQAQYRLSADLGRGIAADRRAGPQAEPKRGLFPAARARPQRSGGDRQQALSRPQSVARRSAGLSRDDARIHTHAGGAMSSAGAALRLGTRSAGRFLRRVFRRAAHDPAHVALPHHRRDRKSTRLNSSHLVISYAVFCLKKKKKKK